MSHYLSASGPVRSADEAEALAEKWLNECHPPLYGDHELGLTDFRDHANGVYFFDCQTRAYIESRDFRHFLLGSSYICVDADTGITARPFASGEMPDTTKMSKKFRRRIKAGEFA